MNTDSSTEILPPALSKGEARSIETQARRHWRTASRNAIQFAAELRRLQDGGAHFIRGFENFGDYAEHIFDGLTAATAKQLSRQGGVLLLLERHHRISLEGHGRDLPGTTALRQLSAIHGTHGEPVMLSVYDRAVKLRPGRPIVDTTVKQAARELLAPKVEELTAEPVTVVPDEEDDGTEETVDPAALAEAVESFGREFEQDLLGTWDGIPSSADRENTEHALQALEIRIARMRQRLGDQS